MNPETEKLRDAMSRPGVPRKWLPGHADAVAELVDAAMDVSWWATANHPDAEWVNHRLRRLARAVVDFKGPQGPPEGDHDHVDVLRCPYPGCPWWHINTGSSATEAAYHQHYRNAHQGGRP